MTSSLTSLERDVLAKFCAGNDQLFRALQRQLQSCTVTARSTSPVGFFTQLGVDESAATPITQLRLVVSDVVAEHPNLQRGAGFALFIQNGFLAMLEGFTFDEPWPSDDGKWVLRYEPVRSHGQA